MLLECMSKETFTYENMSKETFIYENRPIKETFKGDLFFRAFSSQSLRLFGAVETHAKRKLYIWKETYIYEKRPIQEQMRLEIVITMQIKILDGQSWGLSFHRMDESCLTYECIMSHILRFLISSNQTQSVTNLTQLVTHVIFSNEPFEKRPVITIEDFDSLADIAWHYMSWHMCVAVCCSVLQCVAVCCQKDETRNGRQNANRNPRWSSQDSFRTDHLKKDLNFDIEGFGFHFDDHFESHLVGNRLQHTATHWNTLQHTATPGR